MTTNTTLKQRLFWLALILGGILLIQTMRFDATADSNGKPYSVSLNSAVTFPIDI